MGTTDAPVTFGEWVKQRRRALDLTQSELADRSGCSVFALRKIESGERRPSKQLANLLANSLEISVEVLPQFLKVARGDLNLERLDSPRGTKPPSQPSRVAIPGSTLPAFPNSFLGREPELTALCQLVRDPVCRLLSLTGPGGIGKTRLAVEVGVSTAADFSDGVCFVSLAGVRSSSYIIPTVSEALGINFQGHDLPVLQLFRFLLHKQILLIIDNAEHLLDDLSLYTGILKNTAAVKLLVTSRERLHLQEEWVFQIQGLPTPQTDSPENLKEFSSIQLFMQAARRASSGFEPDPSDLPAITRICRLMDGMPLGIELAAGWVAVLPCKDIAHEVEQNLDFLRTNLKNVPERQRSLRAAFDYSWNLLPVEERDVLKQLSIFQDGFERYQAEKVADATLTILHSLVGRSLVRRKQNGRFDLHEIVRQYAFEHLKEDPEYECVVDRHADAYLELLRENGEGLKTDQQVHTLQVLRAEMNNLRTAWYRAVDLGRFDQLDTCIRALGWFCDLTGWLTDGIEMLEYLIKASRLLSNLDQAQKIVGVSRGQQGLLYFRQGRFDTALAVLDESLTLLRPLHQPDLLTDPLVFKGVILHLNGLFEESRALNEEALACAHQAGDDWHAGYAIFNLGFIANFMGNYEAGYKQMHAGIALWRRLGDPSTIALGLNHVSITALQLGLVDEAKAYLNESIDLCTLVGDHWGLGTAVRYLGLAEIHCGNLQEARSLLSKSLRIFSEITTGWDFIRSNIYLALTYELEGNIKEAERIGRSAFTEAIQVDSKPLALEALAGLARLAQQVGNSAAAYRYSQIILGNPQSTYATREVAVRVASEAKKVLTQQQLLDIDKTVDHRSLDSLAKELK